MHYKRHYLQYNDLVFDEYDMVSEDGANYSFRQPTTSYSFQHGSYAPYKKKGVTFNDTHVSLTLILRSKKLPCEYRKYYLRFVKEQLTNQGRLWAVQDNTIIWAWAYITNWSEGSAGRDEYEIDVSFAIPEGIWHKADTRKTFLIPYDVCTVMECLGYKDVNQCKDCCTECVPEPVKPCSCCCDDELTKDMSLCFHLSEIQDFYECTSPYRLVYDCVAAEKFSSDPLGYKLCQREGEGIMGNLYSDTEIATDGVRITIIGQMKDPYIEINGNGNYIKGEYDGTLVINPDGSVYFYEDIQCEPLDVDKWVIPAGMNYGWIINPGYNKVLIDVGSCCPECAYIEVDSLAF